MKRHTLKLAALAVASFGWISLAEAQGPGGGPMRRPGGPGGGPGFGPGGPGGPPVERIAEHLGLSDEQKAQWKAIHEKAREAGEPIMKAAGAAQEAFDKALESDAADAATIGAAAIAMRNAHRQVEAQHQATLDAVKAILTAEQLARMEATETHMRRPGPGTPGSGELQRQRRRRAEGPGPSN